ncbi:type 4a pilus biogenesis protein PilO [Patescibacteria group bacterium]
MEIAHKILNFEVSLILYLLIIVSVSAINIVVLKQKKYYRNLDPILEKPKNRAYTTVIFSFLAISLFSWYAIRPTMQTILYLRREIADKTLLDQQMEDKISNLIEAQAEYEEYQDQLYLIDEAIPINPDSVDVVMQIRNMVESNPAFLSSARIENVPLLIPDKPLKKKAIVPGSEKNEFDISVTLTGDYPGLEQFLFDISSMRRVVTIENISFLIGNDNESSSSASGQLELSLKLKSYYK